jgi:hypothetical protein
MDSLFTDALEAETRGPLQAPDFYEKFGPILRSLTLHARPRAQGALPPNPKCSLPSLMSRTLVGNRLKTPKEQKPLLD